MYPIHMSASRRIWLQGVPKKHSYGKEPLTSPRNLIDSKELFGRKPLISSLLIAKNAKQFFNDPGRVDWWWNWKFFCDAQLNTKVFDVLRTPFLRKSLKILRKINVSAREARRSSGVWAPLLEKIVENAWENQRFGERSAPILWGFWVKPPPLIVYY